MIIQRRNHDVKAAREYFQAISSNPEYISISLSTLWNDTLVDQLFVSKQSISEISQWAHKSLELHPVPEVGGFLWGKYYPQSNGKYTLSIDKFFASENVQYNNTYRIDFGSQTLIEMDRMKEHFPDLVLVGWFHTHPGHSPFLSETDLYTHNWVFGHPYQVAIVLDCLTEGFHTGIFSMQSDGKINNKVDRKDGNHWVLWESMVKEHYEK